MCSYFTVLGGGGDLQWIDIETSRGEYVVAHNGWVMDADPLTNFADEGSQVVVHAWVYVRTYVYVWCYVNIIYTFLQIVRVPTCCRCTFRGS